MGEGQNFGSFPRRKSEEGCGKGKNSKPQQGRLSELLGNTSFLKSCSSNRLSREVVSVPVLTWTTPLAAGFFLVSP